MAEYRLIYWPMLPGRGEFVRLVLEDAKLPYIDVGRQDESEGGGIDAVMKYVKGDVDGFPVFAPPILEHGDLRIAQTANITMYLAETNDLLPDVPNARWKLNQLAMSVADVVAEVHEVHHPISTGMYYEDQRDAAIEAAKSFVKHRIPRWLGYFERAIEGPFVLGEACSYVDLALFHMVEGLEYMFPKGMAAGADGAPKLMAIKNAVKARENVAAYLASERRIPFNETGIFRAYAELDIAP